jgi:TolB-like protein/Tfp pilus assembly protein PilF
MSEPGKAVFISYAHEDSAVAKRLCEALREAGIEVWFDANELRGGDAWDASIKRQIRECALFLPVISAQTQARHEGYFRREWRLAVERTHDMAETAPFLVPVVIDDTPQTQAVVPEQFARMHWVHLPSGLPTPQFVAEVKRQLERSRRSGSTAPHVVPVPVSAGQRRNSGVFILMTVVAAVVMVAAGWWIMRPHATPAAADSAMPAPRISDKSIAVLPFANASDDKDTNAFFADGIQEDILTHLSNIRELRVVSRTSVMQYRGTTKTVPQIAKELGVAFVLEGSVRRSAGRVRVTGQLIKAGTTEQHVWARNYDRDLTDVFAIQTALAQEIASSLHTVLSPQEKSLLERRRTDNLAAYDFYLRAREARNRLDRFESMQALLRAAVELDPAFADAWSELARNYAEQYFRRTARNPAHLASAKDAIDRAVRLAPDSPEVIRNLGNYFLYGHRDFARATGELEKLARLRPNDPEIYVSLGEIQSRQGKWTDALGSFRKATELERSSIDYARRLAQLLHAGRRWDEAIAEQRRFAALLPQQLAPAYTVAFLHFQARGSRREVESFLSSLTPAQANSPSGFALRMNWAIESGDYAEALRLDRIYPENEPRSGYDQGFGIALIMAAEGNLTAARARIAGLPATERARLEREPNNTSALWRLGLAEAILGNKEEALRCARRTVEMMPESLDAIEGPRMSNKLALIYAWAGEKDRALVEAARLLRTPNSEADVHMMRHDPWWFPLRGDPRFLALLDDPANNRPLF